MEDQIEEKVKMKVEKKVKKYVTVAFKVFFGIVAAIVFALLIGYGVMWLWNWLMPEVFNLKAIGYWQAVGLLVLAKVLFGGFGADHSKHRKRKSKKRLEHKLRGRCNRDLSNWKLYDQFWEDEGEKAYHEYLERKTKENDGPIS